MVHVHCHGKPSLRRPRASDVQSLDQFVRKVKNGKFLKSTHDASRREYERNTFAKQKKNKSYSKLEYDNPLMKRHNGYHNMEMVNIYLTLWYAY